MTDDNLHDDDDLEEEANDEVDADDEYDGHTSEEDIKKFPEIVTNAISALTRFLRTALSVTSDLDIDAFRKVMAELESFDQEKLRELGNSQR